MYVCMYVCMDGWMDACMHVCIYIYRLIDLKDSKGMDYAESIFR